MGAASSKMHRILASANPVFRNRTLNDSIAFATMHVSNWRRASSSSSVSKGAIGMPRSFRDSPDIYNGKLVSGFKSSKAVATEPLAAGGDGEIRSVGPRMTGPQRALRKHFRGMGTAEEADCRGFLQRRGLVSEARRATSGDKNWETAKP